jgi:molybdopterin converting factor subunit 1
MCSTYKMNITVLFFATLRSQAGIKALELELPPESRVADLKLVVGARFPQVAPALLETALVSVNREYADDEQIIPDGAEVAFFPPVSGG